MQVVSGTKYKQFSGESPAIMKVISKEQIEQRGYITLQDVMMDLPGFDFSTMQPSGEYPTHFLFRGMSGVGQGKYVVMVDGVPQNDISNGWARNIGYNFTLVDVERIEFVNGPGSSLYGLNAYAGFVNIITKSAERNKSKKQLHLKANSNYGSYNTYFPELFASYTGKSGVHLQLSGRYYYSEGDNGLNRADPGNYFHNNYEPDSVLTTEHGVVANEPNKKLNDGFNTLIDDYYVRGKLQSKGFKLAFNFWRKREGLGSEVVGYEYFTNTKGIDYMAHHQGKTVNMEYEYELGERIVASSKLYYVNTSTRPETGFTYTYQFQSVDNGINPEVEDKKKSYESEGFLIGVEQQFRVAISPNNTLVVGALVEQKIRQYFNIFYTSPTTVISSEEINTFILQPVYFSKNGGFLIQDEHKFTDKLRLVLGGRLDYDQFFGSVFNPRLALVRNINKGFGFKYIYAHGFRAPTIFELYDEWRGNAQLFSEKIITNEVQVSYLVPGTALMKMNVFHNYLIDPISLEPNPNPIEQPIGSNGQHAIYYQNLQNKQQIMGVGFSAKFQFGKRISSYLNYQFLSDGKLEPLDNVAAHKLNAGINYTLLDKVNFNLRMNLIGKTKAPETNRYFYPKTTETIAEVGYDYVTEENPDGYLDPVVLFNLNVTTQNLLKSDKISLKPHLLVKNLFNNKYLLMGRQSGHGVRPVDAIQPSVMNPNGFIPAYHPQNGIQLLGGLTVEFNK
ncbi:MAG: TonB-dependent receptor [Crocinitomicaceae bacterium]